MNLLPAFLIGFSSLIFQTAVLRQFLALSSGNELDIGIALATWLAAVGMGSLIGARFRDAGVLPVLFPAAAVAGQATVMLLPLARRVFGIGIGETASLPVLFASAVLFLVPLCVLIGALYPRMVLHCSGGAGAVYGAEAAGACAAGLVFTFLLAGKVSTPVIVSATAALHIATGAMLFRRKRAVAAAALALVAIIAAVKLDGFGRVSAGELVRQVESRYGEIDVFRDAGQMNIFTSSRFYFSYPDIQADEVQVHLVISMHPSARKVLLVGGSPAAAREVLKYPVESVDFVDLDPAMIRLGGELFSGSDRNILHDRRVRMIAADAREFVRNGSAGRYDLILLNLPPPLTANLNRFYTVEFFDEARKTMRQGGILVLRLPQSHGYIGKRLQLASGAVYASLGAVYPEVKVSSEEYGLCAASALPITTDPVVLASRFAVQNIRTEFFRPYLFDDAFSPMKTSMVEERLREGSKTVALNTDRRPTAYLYSLMLWAESRQSGLMVFLLDHGKTASGVLLAAFLAGTALFLKKRDAAYLSVGSTGFASLGFSVVIILAYQSAFGSVYERIGLLTSLFMAGMAAGAYFASQWAKPLLALRWCGLLMTAFLPAAPLLLSHEVSFYLANAVAGAIAGAEFSSANRFLASADKSQTAGTLYAVDLAGSFLGALLTAVFLVPGLGIASALLVMACLKAAPTVVLYTIRNEAH